MAQWDLLIKPAYTFSRVAVSTKDPMALEQDYRMREHSDTHSVPKLGIRLPSRDPLNEL